MQGPKTLTLSLGPKKAKVFGRPPDGSSVASESMSESHHSTKSGKQTSSKSRTSQNPTLTPSMSSDKKKRQSKIPSHISENNTKPNEYDESFDDVSDFNQSNASPSANDKQRIEKSPSVASRNSRLSSLSKSSTLNNKQQSLSLTTNPQKKKSNLSTISNASNNSANKHFSVASQQQEQTRSPSPVKPKSPSPSPSPSPKKRFSDDANDYNSDNSPDIYESPKSQKKREEYKENYSNVSILPIVGRLIDENAPLEKIGRSINKLEDWQQDLINIVHPIEEQHQILWYNSMVSILEQQNLALAKDHKKILYYDELVQKSREILENHRFSFPAGTLHRFKMAITGPDQSGKSTFLSIFAQQYLLELIASDQWKHTFIFPIDFSLALPHFTDLGSLYCHIVQMTFSALAVQRPLLIQYADSLAHSFQTVITGSPILPKPFLLDEDFRLIIPAVQQFLDIILQCWQDSTAMSSFVVNTFMFPYFISTIFGFRRYTVIADNLDLTDITKNPGPPFIDSPESVFMAEIIKLMLNQSSYIVSGKHSLNLVDLLSTVDSESKGYAQGIETISTLKLIDNNDDDSSSFNITFNGEKEPSIHLSSRYMGGCPLYLYKWKEINEKHNHIEELENSQGNEEEETGDEDIEEEKLSLVNLIQSLLKQIMVSSDGSPYNLSIKSVSPFKSSKK